MQIPESTIHNPQSTIQRSRAFTLIELLVSIAIIFLLIAAASVALKAVRRGANRTESSQALRQIMTAYITYASEHNHRLLPGCIDPNDIGPTAPDIDIRVRDPNNNANTLNAQDTAPYVWRLAKYLDGNWRVMMTDYRSPSLLSRFNDEMINSVFGPGSATNPQIGIAAHPAYGLNSTFLGGDSYHGGAGVTAYSPWNTLGNKPIAATRMSEVKSPEKLIVFAPTEAHDYLTLETSKQTKIKLGSPWLSPPWGVYDRLTGAVSEQQWYIDATTNQYMPTAAAFGNGGGMPTDRLDEDKILLAHLDGSVDQQKREDIGAIQTMTPEAQLRIMSMWSPFALSDK